MDTKKAYLLLSNPNCSAEWIRRMISILAGGYDLQGTTIQVLLFYNSYGTASKAITDIHDIIEHYIAAKRQLDSNDIKTWLCHSVVERSPFKPISKLKALDLSNTWLNSEIELQSQLNSLKKLPDLNLSGGNRLIIPVRMDNGVEDLKIVEALLAYYPAEVIKKAATVICELGDCYINNEKKLSSSVKRALHLIQEKCKLIVVGRRDDAYNNHFTYLQTGCAILDAIRFNAEGELDFLESKTGLMYSPNNLSSRLSVLSFIRMGLMNDLMDGSIQGSLEQWYSNLRLKPTELWDSDLFKSISNVVKDMISWINISSSVFNIDLSDAECDAVVQEMNSIQALASVSTKAERRKSAAETLLESIDNRTDKTVGNEVKYTSLSLDLLDVVEPDKTFGKNHLELSPTALFDLTNQSFNKENFGNQDAKLWRSACLDLWELFFLYPIDQLNKVLTVSELRFSQMSNSFFNKLLSLNATGKQLIDEDIYYRITSSSGLGFEAYTSPLTGFCVENPCDLEFSGKSYFSKAQGNARELNERPKEVQEFVYT